MSEADSLLAELASIRTYLAAVQESLKTGYMPDITSLEKRVADACQDIELAEEAIQKQCLPLLADILQSLDACECGMREWRDDVEKKSLVK
jgi:hypothetical protein